MFRLPQRLFPLSSQRRVSAAERCLWWSWWLWGWCWWAKLRSVLDMSELFGVSGKWAPSHWLWPSQSYPYFLLWSGIKPMNTYKACITSGNRIFFRSVDWRHTPYRTSVQLSKPSDATYCARPMGQPSRGRRLPELGQLTIEMSYLVISTTLPLCQWMFFYYFILFSNVICHCGIYYIIYILHIYVDFSVSSGQPW